MAEVKPYRRLNKFELHQLIGEGAMGVVWKAYDTELRRYVALKLLSTRIGKTREMRDRFLREARTAGGIQHPNIVTVYDLGEAEDQLYIAMELVEGRDLSDLITLREPLPLERKLDIVIELLAGLDFAHQRGIIHRDIKPANIRLQPDGRVKIMDFGIARLQSADHTGSGAIVGTPTYMAPEQITNGAITPATDLFSVGCVLYELLTYQKPFEGESIHGVLYRVLTTDPTPLRAMAPSIPASLERVVTKAMSKAPGDRYDKARTMQQQISGIRSALSGGTDQTTQRLTPAWLRLPDSVLGLVRHTALPARLAALGGLIVVSLMLLWTSFRSNADEVASPPASAARAPTPGTVPTHLNPAVAALRDSAFAAQARAQQVGAMKNNVAAAPLAETLLETGERAATAGDEVRATSRYTSAIAQYRVAVRETDSLRADTKQRLDRTTPLVTALGTRASAARAAGSLARADSLWRANDYVMARLAVNEAEQIAVADGVAPPSRQPADPRAAIGVLIEDLARAVASERVSNLRALYPAISPAEVTGWRQFFAGAQQLTAEFTIAQLTPRGGSATAQVKAVYRFLPRAGGAQREDRPNYEMRFTKTINGWRVASVKETR